MDPSGENSRGHWTPPADNVVDFDAEREIAEASAKAIGEANSPERAGDSAIRNDRMAEIDEEIERLKGETKVLEEGRKDEPRYLKEDARIEPKVKLGVSVAAIGVSMAGMSFNAAYAVLETTQSLPTALLATSILPTTALGVEAYASLSVWKRAIVDKAMTAMFTLCGLTYLICFANNYAFTPGVDEVELVLGSEDTRLQMVSLILLEFSLCYGIYRAIRRFLHDLRWPVANPRYRALADEIDDRRELIAGLSAERRQLLGDEAIDQAKASKAAAQAATFARFRRA